MERSCWSLRRSADHRLALLGYIAHKTQNDRTRLGLHGLEHDVDRKFGAILAQAKQIHGSAHLARPGMRIVVFPVARMMAAKTRRDKIFDGLPEEFRLGVTE